MKSIPVSCIPILALASFHCGAAEQQMAAPEQADGLIDQDAGAAADRVKQALRNAGGVAAKIAVSSHANTVLLSGTVNTLAEVQRIKTAAEAAAQGVRVSSQIEVDAERQAAVQHQSMELVRAVEQALRSDGATAELRLLVSVDDQQRIVLFGPVPSRQARAAAERVAAGVAGVKRIDNRLVVPGEQ